MAQTSRARSTGLKQTDSEGQRERQGEREEHARLDTLLCKRLQYGFTSTVVSHSDSRCSSACHARLTAEALVQTFHLEQKWKFWLSFVGRFGGKSAISYDAIFQDTQQCVCKTVRVWDRPLFFGLVLSPRSAWAVLLWKLATLVIKVGSLRDQSPGKNREEQLKEGGSAQDHRS